MSQAALIEQRREVRLRIRCFPRAALLVLPIGVAVLVSLPGCGEREPFELVRASGRACYEDGTVLPVRNLTLNFHPQSPPKDRKTFPRTGSAVVDPQTGGFSSITSHRQDDGLVKGKHKVTLHAPGRLPLPAEVASDIYSDSQRTPLEVDTAARPFDLRVVRPTK